MKLSLKGVVLASIMAAASLAAGNAFAQSPCPECGSQVAGAKIDPAIRKVAQYMDLERSTALLIGQMHTMEMVANGTMVDLEAAQLGAAVPVSRYTWNTQMYLHAQRVDYESMTIRRQIRVAMDGKAWNETWSTDGKKLSTTPVDATVAALRNQLVWVEPHAFITASAFASGKVCLTVAVKECTDATATVGQEGGKTVITLTKDGNTYKGTVSPTNRIASIETTLKLPSGTKKLVASYSGYRSGEVAEQYPDPSYGAKSLDKFHNGNYWPEKISWDLEGTKVLDLTVTEGWGNPYTVYADPELLAKAQ